MAVSSMTGFARAAGMSGAWRWAFELKTVNAKGLATIEPRSEDRSGLVGAEPPQAELVAALEQTPSSRSEICIRIVCAGIAVLADPNFFCAQWNQLK